MQWKFLNWLKDTKNKFSNTLFTIDQPEVFNKPNSDIKSIRKKIKKIEFITKQKTSSSLSGQYKSRFRGQGMQFSDIQVYQYGDDVRHIDWRTSARSQQVYVKNFEEEREINIICAMDISASNAFGSQTLNKRETLALGLASIALTAGANRDRIGLLLFTDQIEDYIPPKRGQKHALRLVNEILTYNPKGKKTNIDLALKALASITKQKSIILLASDFNEKINKHYLNRLSRRHDLIALHAFDPREQAIPSVGLLQLKDPETGETLLVDTSSSSFQNNFSQEQKKARENLYKYLQATGASIIPLPTDQDPSDKIIQFFQRRKQFTR